MADGTMDMVDVKAYQVRELTADALERHGMTVVERFYGCGQDTEPIDMLAQDEYGAFHFVKVRPRRITGELFDFVHGEGAADLEVTSADEKSMRRYARSYVRKNEVPARGETYTFDVISAPYNDDGMMLGMNLNAFTDSAA